MSAGSAADTHRAFTMAWNRRSLWAEYADERSTRPTQSDSRRSCAESARIVAAAPRASVLASRQSADLQISEQHGRARSSGDQATLCVDGWVQVVRERGHHDRWHRAGPSHSQGTILVWPRPSAPWLVEEGRMGDGTRVGMGSEKTRASSRPKYPSMHQNRCAALR